MPTPGFDINELKRRMQGATQSLKHELGGLRTGRAAASMPHPVIISTICAARSRSLALVARIWTIKPR